METQLAPAPVVEIAKATKSRKPGKPTRVLFLLVCLAVFIAENWHKVNDYFPLRVENQSDIDELISKIEQGYVLDAKEITRLNHEPGIQRKLSPRGLFNLFSRSKPGFVDCQQEGDLDLDKDALFFGQMNAYMREGKPFPCAPNYMWGKWKFVYLKSGKVFFGVDGSQYMIPILGMGAHSDITDAMRPLFSDIAGGGYIEVLRSGTIVAGGYSGSFGRVPETQQSEVVKILKEFFPDSKVEWEFFQEDQWGNTSRANE